MSFPTELKHRRLLSGTHTLIHTRSLGCWLSRGRPSNLQLCPALPREPSPACPAGPTETNEGLLQHLIHYGESRDRSGKHCQRTPLFWTERINWVVVGNCSPAMTPLSITNSGESANEILFLALVYLRSKFKFAALRVIPLNALLPLTSSKSKKMLHLSRLWCETILPRCPPLFFC